MQTHYDSYTTEFAGPPIIHAGIPVGLHDEPEIRTPRTEDIGGIVALVEACSPFLTAHESYIYWMYLRFFRETCAVAELDGEIVGWSSILPVAHGRYFIHQTGIAPDLRSKGLAGRMLSYLLEQLKDKAVEFEFTIDRKNSACQALMRSVAASAGMQVAKRREPVELLEEQCGDELYVMTPAAEVRSPRSVNQPPAAA